MSMTLSGGRPRRSWAEAPIARRFRERRGETQVEGVVSEFPPLHHGVTESRRKPRTCKNQRGRVCHAVGFSLCLCDSVVKNQIRTLPSRGCTRGRRVGGDDFFRHLGG